MTEVVIRLAATLRARLREFADPVRAPAMQRYMKSAMPFLGVGTPERRALCKELFTGLSWKTSADWQVEVLAIWRGAQFREERYCAIHLTGVRAARPFQRVDALPMYEEMIVTGAWWDLVDEVATHRCYDILCVEREPMKRAMLGWAEGENMWKRRCAILCQVRARAATDLALLEACIAPSLQSTEFFLRKAIGWALRSYSWTDPRWVEAYVTAHERELSPLSKREALKRIRLTKNAAAAPTSCSPP